MAKGSRSYAASERKARHESGPNSRMRCIESGGESGCAAAHHVLPLNVVDKPVASRQRSAGRTQNREGVVVGCRRRSTGAVAGDRYGVEHAIKQVLELRPDLELVLLLDPEVSPHTERFSRLPLPPVVDVVRSRDSELAGGGSVHALGFSTSVLVGSKCEFGLNPGAKKDWPGT